MGRLGAVAPMTAVAAVAAMAAVAAVTAVTAVAAVAAVAAVVAAVVARVAGQQVGGAQRHQQRDQHQLEDAEERAVSTTLSETARHATRDKSSATSFRELQLHNQL